MSEMFSKPAVYAVKNRDEERMKSQSGGMFAALSDVILDRGGIVYGCVFNEKFEAVHVRAAGKEERDVMRKSKYVQSNMLDVMTEILDDLKNGKEVLFSGTSCQVAGVRSFINKNDASLSEKLYCVDLVCHGVPSPLVWKDYLLWERNKAGSEIKNVICRNKLKFGWKPHVVTIDFENGNSTDSRVFPMLFYSHKLLRPACYKCPYKDVIHPGDVTIGDFWGIENVLPDFRDEKAVSLVLVNDQKGAELFDLCRGILSCKETELNEATLQRPLISPYDVPENREQFWKDYQTHKFDYIAKKYGSRSFGQRVVRKLKRILRRIVK